MLYLPTPYGAKRVMFQEAAALGVSEIRLDLEVSAVFPEAGQPPDWAGVDEVMQLSEQYQLAVLANLTAMPAWESSCGGDYRCPSNDPLVWGSQVEQIVAHTRGVIDNFEAWNEPDGAWSWRGTAQQYGQMLAVDYAAVHRVNPRARVVLGGIMDPTSTAWLDEALGVADARFDVANIHVRMPLDQITSTVRRWAHRFAEPLWITEMGYPADPAYQTYPGFQGGAQSQAAYLREAIPAMLAAGARKVFVTERDEGTGRFASEGVLHTQDPLPADPHPVPRPSFFAVQRLARTL